MALKKAYLTVLHFWMGTSSAELKVLKKGLRKVEMMALMTAHYLVDLKVLMTDRMWD